MKQKIQNSYNMYSTTLYLALVQFTKQQLSLITLWAFVEAGLGSILHAFHLPFTGLVLGGFAVVIISLLAQSQSNSFKIIVQAMLIVLAIKVVANPATSPFAYIAVAFQGLIGAIVYRLLGVNLFAHLLFAIIAMVESAMQKLLVVTLFFGKSFWQGLDALGNSILQQLYVATHLPFAHAIIIAYIALFVLWAIALGFWMQVLPQQIHVRKNLYQHLQPITAVHQPKPKNNSKIILFLVIVICIAFSFFITTTKPFLNAGIYLLRTISVLLIWQIIIVPIWAKWINKKQMHMQQSYTFMQVQQAIPSIANIVKPLYLQVSSQYSGFKKWKEFLIGLIVCSWQE